MKNLIKSKANFGTAPVFLTAISTILGAIMFLRFGYAVGSLGFIGALIIIVVGHLVTIPTAMAIAEIATNQKVEGGGEYYIISRSFGINIGAAIGVALYFSQAISVAFYVIAFAEAFTPITSFINDTWGILIPSRFISVPALVILGWLMITKGAKIGMKVLYVVVGILFLSLLLFFLGSPEYQLSSASDSLVNKFIDSDQFFVVFAIVFPGFTGMTAGVGLSGDLKDPSKSIPWGTLSATILGMLVYIFIAYKLAVSAAPADLINDQFVMSNISLWGPIIPIGLAAATISSALGSMLVAPRTLQALSVDRILPFSKINRWLGLNHPKRNEPVNATRITCLIALFFVSIGDVNFIAEIISMFFMVTYGAICTISFFQHFAADPSYRPVFRSRWYISLLGALLCFYLMFKMNTVYAFVSLLIMVLIYLVITNQRKSKEGMATIFQGVMFQLMRQIQVFLQKSDKAENNHWRPSVICISEDFFNRPSAFELMHWLSHRYGFGTYIHYKHGYLSKESNRDAKIDLKGMIQVAKKKKSKVYVDTMISPSYTSAIAQSLQLPSISGQDVNLFLFEYSRSEPSHLIEIIENYPLVKSAEFDACVLSTTEKGFGHHKEIHIWITPSDFTNANLMILLGYIILGHPDWKNAQIKILAIFPESEIREQREKLNNLIVSGRLPISAHNIEVITHKQDVSNRGIIRQKSKIADLIMIGFRSEALKQLGANVFQGYDDLGNLLFVNATKRKLID